MHIMIMPHSRTELDCCGADVLQWEHRQCSLVGLATGSEAANMSFSYSVKTRLLYLKNAAPDSNNGFEMLGHIARLLLGS